MDGLRGDQIIVRTDRQPEPLKRSANLTGAVGVVFIERDNVKRRKKISKPFRVFISARAFGNPKPQLEKRDGRDNKSLSAITCDPGPIANTRRAPVDQRDTSIGIEENCQSSASRVCDFG